MERAGARTTFSIAYPTGKSTKPTNASPPNTSTAAMIPTRDSMTGKYRSIPTHEKAAPLSHLIAEGPLRLVRLHVGGEGLFLDLELQHHLRDQFGGGLVPEEAL